MLGQNEPLTKEDAKDLQNNDLWDKYQISLAKIMEWNAWYDKNVYVSFSGGKDSAVCAYLAALAYGGTDYTLHLLFIDTGLEYPEIKQFAPWFAKWLENKFNIKVVLHKRRPDMSFKDVLVKYGYPIISKEVAQVVSQAKGHGKTANQRIRQLSNEHLDKNGDLSQFNIPQWKFLLDADFNISDQCCVVMKKRPAKRFEKETHLMMITGELASESRLRFQKWMKAGCNAFELGRPKSTPLAPWHENDVLEFIHKNNIPICSVYGDIDYIDSDQYELFPLKHSYFCTGCDKTGCIFCGFGAHLEKGTTRYQRLKTTHPKLYDYCLDSDNKVKGIKSYTTMQEALHLVGEALMTVKWDE